MLFIYEAQKKFSLLSGSLVVPPVQTELGKSRFTTAYCA